MDLASLDLWIKILIALVIAALIMLLSFRRGQKVDLRGMDERSHRRQLLEEVSRQVSAVHFAYQNYLALALEFSRYGASWPMSRKDELRQATDQLVMEFKQLTTAESTLLLLGEKKLERALRSYGSKIVALRRMIHAEKPGFTGEELTQLDATRKEISELREAFYDVLSNRFKTVEARHAPRAV